MQEKADVNGFNNAVQSAVDDILAPSASERLDRLHNKKFSLAVAAICKQLGIKNSPEYGSHSSKTRTLWNYYLRVSGDRLADYENADGYNRLVIELSTTEYKAHDTVNRYEIQARRIELFNGEVLLEENVGTEHDFRDSYLRRNPVLISRSLGRDGSFSEDVVENDALSFITTIWDEIVRFDDRIACK